MNLTDLKWPEVAALDRDTPVIFPVAALEQHGRHMPVFTDSLLCGEIVRRVEERLGKRVLIAPLQWLGNSEHHMDFPGTMSAAPRVYLDLLANQFENFIAHGFRRLVMFNGHGGNDVPGKQVVFELRQKHRARRDLLLLFATCWNLETSGETRRPRRQFRRGVHGGLRVRQRQRRPRRIQRAHGRHSGVSAGHLLLLPDGGIPLHRPAMARRARSDLPAQGRPSRGKEGREARWSSGRTWRRTP